MTEKQIKIEEEQLKYQNEHHGVHQAYYEITPNFIKCNAKFYDISR